MPRYEAEYQTELTFRMACFILIDEYMASRIISYLTRLKYAPDKLEYSNREEATSALAYFHAGPLCWSNWNLEMLIFSGNLGNNPRSKVRTNNKLNPHMAPGQNRTRDTLVGGECSHHCAIPATL